MSRMPGAANETVGRNRRIADALDVHDAFGERSQPVSRRTGIGRHSRKSPERHEHRSARSRRGFSLENRIALAAQHAPPRRPTRSLRGKQAVEDLVFVDERQIERRRQPSRERGLATARQPRDEHEGFRHAGRTRRPGYYTGFQKPYNVGPSSEMNLRPSAVLCVGLLALFASQVGHAQRPRTATTAPPAPANQPVRATPRPTAPPPAPALAPDAQRTFI